MLINVRRKKNVRVSPAPPSLAHPWQQKREKSCIASYLLQGVAAKEKKERIEEQPHADIIICNVVYPDTGEILHRNVSSQGVAERKDRGTTRC